MSDDHKDEHGEGGGHGGGGGGHGGGGHGGGGGHAEGEHEGAPEWLISFADNVALMMGFFVILLAMNMGPKGSPVQGGEPSERENYDAGRQADFILAIRDGFNSPIKMDSTDPREAWLRKRVKERKGGPATDSSPEGVHPEVQAIRPSDYKNITAMIEFDERSSLLTQSAREVLAQTAQKLKGQRWVIEVRGHVSPYEHPRNQRQKMELSYDRALAVASALVEFGLSWDNLAVVSKGDSDRLVARPGDAEHGRSNQRVEVVVTNESIAEDPYTLNKKPPPGGGGAPQHEPTPSPDSGGNGEEPEPGKGSPEADHATHERE